MTIFLSGSEALYGKQLLDGIFLCIDKENKTGGIQTKLIYLDNKFEPTLAKKHIDEFTEKGIYLILQPAGSILIKKYMPIIKQKKVFVYSGTSSPALRDSNVKNLIHYVPSADQSAKMLTEYAITELNLKKFAITYQKGVYGEEALRGTKEILEKYNLKENKDWISIGILPNVISAKEPTTKFKEFNPEAIISFTGNILLQNLIRKLGIEFLHDKTILGIQSNIERKKMVRGKGLKYVGTQLVPDPLTSEIEIVKEYRKLAKAKGQKINESSLESYIGMSILLDKIKKITSKITKK